MPAFWSAPRTSSIESSSGATCSALRVSKVCARRQLLVDAERQATLVDDGDPVARPAPRATSSSYTTLLVDVRRRPSAGWTRRGTGAAPAGHATR